MFGEFGPEIEGTSGGGASNAAGVTVDDSGLTYLDGQTDAQAAFEALDGLPADITDSMNLQMRPLEDVLAGFALEYYADQGLQEYPHTRIDTFTDDADLTGDYVYDEAGDFILAIEPSYSTTYTSAQPWNANQAASGSFRYIIPASWISQSGNAVKITLKGRADVGCAVSHVAIGERSGTTVNTTATPVEFMFSGSPGCNVPQNGTITSDALEFTIDETKSYLVIVDYNGSIATAYKGGSVPESSYRKDGIGNTSYNEATPSGFSQDWGAVMTIDTISVSPAIEWTDIDVSTTAFTALNEDPTSAYCVVDLDPPAGFDISTDFIAKVSINGGTNKETFTFDTTPILETGTRQLYRGDTTITARTDDQVEFYFETVGVVSDETNVEFHGYVAGLKWE